MLKNYSLDKSKVIAFYYVVLEILVDSNGKLIVNI